MKEEIIVNVAICEDQAEWTESLEKHLTEFRKSHRNVKWEAFRSAEELLEYAARNNYVYDILITDIEMKGMSGIELANMLRENDSGLAIFFLTSHDEYIRKCFRSAPLNFWDKPINYEEFKEDMERAIQILSKNEQVFKCKINDEYHRIPYKNIIFFHSAGKKIRLHTKMEDYEFYGSFKEYDKIWNEAGFVRTNRFCYININFIERLKQQEIYLLNGEIIKASPIHFKKIKNMLFEYDCLNIEE